MDSETENWLDDGTQRAVVDGSYQPGNKCGAAGSV